MYHSSEWPCTSSKMRPFILEKVSMNIGEYLCHTLEAKEIPDELNF